MTQLWLWYPVAWATHAARHPCRLTQPESRHQNTAATTLKSQLCYCCTAQHSCSCSKKVRLGSQARKLLPVHGSKLAMDSKSSRNTQSKQPADSLSQERQPPQQKQRTPATSFTRWQSLHHQQMRQYELYSTEYTGGQRKPPLDCNQHVVSPIISPEPRALHLSSHRAFLA